MSSFLDLPDELLLEVLSYTEIADVLKCGQVSKRIRTISNDNSLFQTVNLSGKYVKTDLLATVIDRGCKSLNLSDSSIRGNLSVIQNSKLRKLDITNCRASPYDAIEELLASCHSLQILSLKGLPLTPRMVISICQNSQTMQVLNLYYSYFEEEWYKEIMKTCQEMRQLILEGPKVQETKDQSNRELMRYSIFFLYAKYTLDAANRNLILDSELLHRSWS